MLLLYTDRTRNSLLMHAKETQSGVWNSKYIPFILRHRRQQDFQLSFYQPNGEQQRFRDRSKM